MTVDLHLGSRFILGHDVTVVLYFGSRSGRWQLLQATAVALHVDSCLVLKVDLYMAVALYFGSCSVRHLEAKLCGGRLLLFARLWQSLYTLAVAQCRDS